MFKMFTQLFLSITSFFSAFEKVGAAANHLADWAEESSAAFADEARIERQKKLALLKADLKAVENKTTAAKAA